MNPLEHRARAGPFDVFPAAEAAADSSLSLSPPVYADASGVRRTLISARNGAKERAELHRLYKRILPLLRLVRAFRSATRVRLNFSKIWLNAPFGIVLDDGI